MFTVFHVFEWTGAALGLASGLKFGPRFFGLAGAVLGAAAGGSIGFVLGRLPYLIGFAWLRCRLKHSDAATLKGRLKTEYYISHLIIAELVVRGEPVEQFRAHVDSLLHSDSKRRRFGEVNRRIWFPETAPPGSPPSCRRS